MKEIRDLNTLSEKHQAYHFAEGDRGFECKEGWWDILNHLGAILSSRGVEVRLVKEKFGGMRVHYDHPDGPDDVSDAAITLAEWLSNLTCEICGMPGRIRGDFWLKTRCDIHETIGEENGV